MIGLTVYHWAVGAGIVIGAACEFCYRDVTQTDEDGACYVYARIDRICCKQFCRG